MPTSFTQSKFEIHQPLQEKRMSVLEQVAKCMNEGERTGLKHPLKDNKRTCHSILR